MNRELLRLRVQLGKDRTVVKNRIHAVLAKNGVKHEFTDLFGVGGRNYLRALELPKLQRIALDVLMRQLESVDKEVEFVQKQIAVIAREDEDIIILMTIPGIDYYSAMIIYCMLSRKESYRYERKTLTESKLKRLRKTVC